MADESHADSRIWRAIEEHRARALHQLDSVAANALGDLFARLPREPAFDATHELAKSLARDLTAAGITVHDSSTSLPTGGVWRLKSTTVRTCTGIGTAILAGMPSAPGADY